MKSNLLPFVFMTIACAVLAGVGIWFMREQGEQIRAEMRASAELAAERSAEAMAAAVEERAGELASELKDAPGGLLDELQEMVKGRPAEGAGASKERDVDVEDDEEDGGARRGPFGFDFDPIGAVEEAAKVLHRTTREVDELVQHLARLNEAEEREVGAEAHAFIAAHHRLRADPKLVAKLEQLAAPLLARRTRKNVPYRFHVVDDDEVNAFAHVGAHVYVHTGLIALAQSDVELQMVIGHEIAHADLRHVVDRMTYVVRAGQLTFGLGGDLAGSAYQAIAAGYSEDQELEADLWSYRTLRALGAPHDELVAIFRRMRDHFAAEGLEPEPEGEPASALDALGREIEHHLRTHPPTQERIDRLEALR